MNYTNKTIWQKIIIYLVIAGTVYGLFYFFTVASKGNGYQNSSTVSTINSAQNITIGGNEFAFTPSTITVNKGQPIQITFNNAGNYPHNLTIADLNVQTKTIAPGQSDTIQFTPNTAGSYQFTCTVPGHADKGMIGTLIVK